MASVRHLADADYDVQNVHRGPFPSPMLSWSVSRYNKLSFEYTIMFAKCFYEYLLNRLGISMAKIICSSSKWLSLRRNQWLLVASMILGSAVGTYSLLLLSGTDPAWSIARAFKWCAKREYIHVDTTPFYSLVRYSGSAFGLGLGLTSTYAMFIYLPCFIY